MSRRSWSVSVATLGFLALVLASRAQEEATEEPEPCQEACYAEFEACSEECGDRVDDEMCAQECLDKKDKCIEECE